MKSKLLLLFLVLGFFSCDKLLEIEPEGTLSGDILTNEATIQNALTGAYYNLSGISDGNAGGELLGGDFMLIPELMSHVKGTELTWDIVNAPQYDIFAQSEAVTSLNGRVTANWLRAYETISSVNNILANISKIADSDARARIEGEALAIRGIIYFEMGRLYGPHYEDAMLSTEVMPILTDPVLSVDEINSKTFGTVSDIYTRVEEDLITASLRLKPFGKNGSALSYYACQAYLCRVYMNTGDYGDAVTAASNIISDGLYTLEGTEVGGNPIDAFHNVSNSSEDIYATQQTLSNNSGDRSTGGGITAYYSSLSESGLGVLGVLRNSLGSSSFFRNFAEFSDSDLRKSIKSGVSSATISSEIDAFYYKNLNNNTDEILSSSKYISAQHVIPVIRLAEIYLNRAESIFETDFDVIDAQALSDLNMVRTRSGLDALVEADFAGDPDAFYDSIVVEKKREFFFEGGHLLYDLKRRRSYLGDPAFVVGTNKDPLSDEFILPTPQAEVDSRD